MHAIEPPQSSTLVPSSSSRPRTRLPRGIRGTGLLGLLLGLSLTAQVPGTQPRSIADLKGFFQQNCVRCHGLDGSARDPEGNKLGGLDFTKAAKDFKELAGPASERELRKMAKTIRKGIFFGRIMPSWKDHLSQEDADLMVREVLLKSERGKAIEPGGGTRAAGPR